MDLKGVFDPGGFAKQEIEEALSPVTERVDDALLRIKKIQVTLESIDRRLDQLEPLVALLRRFGFLKS